METGRRKRYTGTRAESRDRGWSWREGTGCPVKISAKKYGLEPPRAERSGSVDGEKNVESLMVEKGKEYMVAESYRIRTEVEPGSVLVPTALHRADRDESHRLLLFLSFFSCVGSFVSFLFPFLPPFCFMLERRNPRHGVPRTRRKACRELAARRKCSVKIGAAVASLKRTVLIETGKFLGRWFLGYALVSFNLSELVYADHGVLYCDTCFFSM